MGAPQIVITVTGPVTVYTTTPAVTNPLRSGLGPVRLTQGALMPQELTLSLEYEVVGFIDPTTPGGQPAPVDGAPVWTVTAGPGTIAETTPPDPKKRWLGATAAGDVSFQVEADADLGAGVVTLVDTYLIHFSNPMAANLGASFGEQRLKETP